MFIDLQIYQDFESPFLQVSENFYQEEGAKLIESVSHSISTLSTFPLQPNKPPLDGNPPLFGPHSKATQGRARKGGYLPWFKDQKTTDSSGWASVDHSSHIFHPWEGIRTPCSEHPFKKLLQEKLQLKLFSSPKDTRPVWKSGPYVFIVFQSQCPTLTQSHLWCICKK